MSAHCDKCGQPVSIHNSCIILEEGIMGYTLSPFIKDRHLMPEGACEGSPHRAAKIATDLTWSAAYQKLQKLTAMEALEMYYFNYIEVEALAA